MSCVLYYSNYCEHSKKLIQALAKSALSKEIHFACIDNRFTTKDGKTMIVLENAQQLVLPDTVVRVPALLLLNENFRVVYGEDIYQHFRPKEEVVQRQATQQNMEPNAFSFSSACSGGFGIVSDQFSFLDMNAEELNAQGAGGLRQMHSYVPSNYTDQMHSVPEEAGGADLKKAGKLSQELTVDKLQQMREQEMANIAGGMRRA